jgi:diamine N-acetyltransferase
MKGKKNITLMAEEGATLSSGSLRLYALPYGCIDLYNYDPLNRRCAVGIMVASEYRREGYALAMLQALERQQAASLHTLYADIAATNTASLALFQKAGYQQVGCFREWLVVDDKYIDTIRVQKILKET